MGQRQGEKHAPHHDHDHAHGHEHGHGQGHNHGKGHGHHHHHPGPPPKGHGRAFAIGIGLNAAFVVIEAVFGFLSGSMALLADAGHNLSDVMALVMAWGASVLAARPAQQGFTYGMKSSTILAAIANGALLWIALGMILLETIQRFFYPEPVAGKTMMIVAAVGIVVNAASALLFAKGRKHDLNLRAAFQHLMADAVVSASVVAAGFGIWLTGLEWIDPAAGLVLTISIAWASWDLLREAVKMGLHAVPAGIDEAKVRDFLLAQLGVSAIHDMHIWGMSTTETAFTAHLVMPGGWPGDAELKRIVTELEKRFGIHHATVQVETGVECAAGC
jgi:cobalt-zinc-cadmium efflux system protein